MCVYACVVCNCTSRRSVEIRTRVMENRDNEHDEGGQERGVVSRGARH